MKIRKNEQGFLILEAVISIFIVGTTMVTFMLVLATAFRQNINNRDYAIASGLAQEGVELIRNIRDNNWKENQTAFDGNGTFKFPSNGCYQYDFYSIASKLSSCSASLTKLKLGTSGQRNGLYQYSLGNSTKFSRKITISGSADERNVTSEVFWRPAGGTSDVSVKVVDVLNNWGDK